MIRIERTATFIDWLRGLRDVKAQRQIARRLVKVGTGHFGDVESVGGKVSELRIHYGPGYRVYFTRQGDTVVLLLVGGDKSTQKRDIKQAKDMVAGP